MQIEFSFPPPERPWTTNEDRNLHPMKRAAKIKAWKGAASLFYSSHMAKTGQKKALPGRGIVSIVIPFERKPTADPMNLCGTVGKAVIDGLVAAGAWPDDGPAYVGHREPVLVKGGDVLVTIELD